MLIITTKHNLKQPYLLSPDLVTSEKHSAKFLSNKDQWKRQKFLKTAFSHPIYYSIYIPV